jgi:hypothetical protein
MWKLTLGYSIEQWGWSSCMRVLKGMSFFVPLENMDFVCLLELFWKERQIHTTGFQLLKLWQPIIGFCNSATQSVFITAIWVQFEWWDSGDMLAWFSRPVVPGCGTAAVHKAIKRVQLIPLSPLLLLHLSCLSPLILNRNAVSIAHLFRCSVVA